MQTAIKFNYQDYLQLPEDKRYEIIDGDLFMVPSPNEAHQRFLVTLTNIMVNYVRKNKLGSIYCAPFDVLFSEEDIVQPDIIFVSNENRKIITKDNIKGAPDLLVEILSPGTSKRDLGIKKKLYAKNGVCEYWIVDPAQETIEVLNLKEGAFLGKSYNTGVAGQTSRLSSSVIQGFDIDIKEIFV